MPEISRFLGIVVLMYYKEHGVPHFHVRYGEHRASFSIANLELLDGSLPGRVVALILEWAFAHRDELRSDWERAAAGQPLLPIAPLV